MAGVGKDDTQVLGLWKPLKVQRLEELTREGEINSAEMKAKVCRAERWGIGHQAIFWFWEGWTLVMLLPEKFVVVHWLSWLFATSWTAACQASLSSTISQSLLKLKSIESMMSSNHLILCHPLLLNLSQHQGLFQWTGSSHQVAKVSELQLQHQSC